MENIQTALFDRIKDATPSQANLADHLSELLGVSKDSVYRRMKGEKPLLFEEIVILAKTYNISLDEILNLGTEDIVFNGQLVNEDNFKLEHYLQSIIDNLSQLHALGDARMYYISKDIPVFYYLMFPEVAAFKFFVWFKTQMQFEELKDAKFTLEFVTPEVARLCREAAELYVSLPSVEILNADNILNDLRQLEYYKDTRVISDPGLLELVYDKLDDMVTHMESQAIEGSKFMPGQTTGTVKQQLYVNDFYVGDNTVIATAGKLKMVFLNHAAINFVSTMSSSFVDYNMEFTNNLIKKSALISEVGERTRSRFFNLIHERIDRFRSHNMHSMNRL